MDTWILSGTYWRVHRYPFTTHAGVIVTKYLSIVGTKSSTLFHCPNLQSFVSLWIFNCWIFISGTRRV